MTAKIYEYASLDDVIFEGRNRAYGAYVLRKLYPENLGKGLASAIAIFVLLLCIPLVKYKLSPPDLTVITPAIPDGKIIIDPTVYDPEPFDPQPSVSTPLTPKATNTNETPTHIVKELTKQPIKPITPAEPGAETGPETRPGEPGGTGIDEPGNGGSGTDPNANANAPAPIDTKDYVDKMPEFPGGEAALTRYLSTNTKFTKVAERMHLSGLVVVSFVVNHEGNITDIKIMKSLGGGLDEEAMRVVKAMPKWQPGKNNGHPVNVRYNLPIRFNLAN